MMPEAYFWDFYTEIRKIDDTYCEIDYYNTLYCTFNEESYKKLPELEFEIEGKSYRVPRESLYVPFDEYEDLIYVEVTYIEGWDEWLFGLTFLENYYAVYDMDNQKVGFAISKNSSMAEINEQESIALAAAPPMSEEQVPQASEAPSTMTTAL